MTFRSILFAALVSIPGLPALAQPMSTVDQQYQLGMPTGDIFGFSEPTDVGNLGDKNLDWETTTLIGKRRGRYASPSLKTELSATVTNNFALYFSPFVTGHQIRSVPDLADKSQIRFDGLSTEMGYRFLERSNTNAVAATLAVEPRWARVDTITGERVSAYGTEVRLLIDAVLVPRQLYGALNLNYALGTQKAQIPFDANWVSSSGTNVSGALTYQVNESLLVGFELRYLTAYAGAFLNRMQGRALYGGPNLLLNLTDNTMLNITWTPQITGSADRTGDAIFDLGNFERQQLRVKLATTF